MVIAPAFVIVLIFTRDDDLSECCLLSAILQHRLMLIITLREKRERWSFVNPKKNVYCSPDVKHRLRVRMFLDTG